jgi:acetyl-CoA synthetase
VYDEQGNEVGPGGGGYLVLKSPWPAMLRGSTRTTSGTRRRTGHATTASTSRATVRDRRGRRLLAARRVDDVMNVSGHRISTIEVESALVDPSRRAEAAVCGRNDPQTGQAIVAYVTLKGGKEGSPEKLAELRNHVGEKIGPIAKPANIVFTPELPKTRSGKIMRRLLRDVAENRPLGDTTTLADPTVVEEIKTRAETSKATD